MAMTKLSAANYVQRGYGQVEPNHLSAQRTGQIYAQLPVDAAIKVLENGQFVKYNYADGAVNFAADGGEWMLVYNEVKVYDERHQQDCDFAMLAENYNGYIAHAGIAANTADREPAVLGMVPRVFKTNVGDIFTTNTIATETEKTELEVGNLLAPRAVDGYLEVVEEGAEGMLWQVVKVYTMPDGQRGVKIVRIA